MSTQTIETMSRSLTDFHPYMLFTYDKTSMTIPSILYHSLSIKVGNPRIYIKKMASQIKADILSKNVPLEKLQGKLSGKVQDFAWCEVIGGLASKEIPLTEFSSAKLIPYSDRVFCANTSMTVPMFLFNLIKEHVGGSAKDATKYIKSVAEPLKEKIFIEYAKKCGFDDISKISDKDLGVLAYQLKGKVSHKIQENLWLQFIPDDIKNSPISA
jgi:hypothetical protein